MNRFAFGIISFIFSADLFAQTISAGELEKVCVSKVESDQNVCKLVVKAFMDGFIEGVAKGAIDTYKFDPQVYSSVKDAKMKDMAPRISKVVENSTCIQKVTVSDMVSTYLDYVEKNPSIRSKNYREAMTRGIAASYCKAG